MNEDDKKFALVLGLSGVMLDRANLATRILREQFAISYMARRGAPPHITIDSEFQISSPETMKRFSLRRSVKKIFSYPPRTAGRYYSKSS